MSRTTNVMEFRIERQSSMWFRPGEDSVPRFRRSARPEQFRTEGLTLSSTRCAHLEIREGEPRSRRRNRRGHLNN